MSLQHQCQPHGWHWCCSDSGREIPTILWLVILKQIFVSKDFRLFSVNAIVANIGDFKARALQIFYAYWLRYYIIIQCQRENTFLGNLAGLGGSKRLPLWICAISHTRSLWRRVIISVYFNVSHSHLFCLFLRFNCRMHFCNIQNASQHDGLLVTRRYRAFHLQTISDGNEQTGVTLGLHSSLVNFSQSYWRMQRAADQMCMQRKLFTLHLWSCTTRMHTSLPFALQKIDTTNDQTESFRLIISCQCQPRKEHYKNNKRS